MSYAPFLSPSRSRSFRPGRPRASGGTVYYQIPGVLWNTISTFAPTTGTDYYEAWVATSPIVVDQIAAEVTTLISSQNFRIGFYAATSDLQPVGRPLADSGDISTTTTGVKTYTPSTPVYCPAGLYVSVYNTDASGVAMRTASRASPVLTGGLTDVDLGGSMGLQRMWGTRAYAAFPNPGTAWDTVGGVGTAGADYMVFYRLSAA